MKAEYKIEKHSLSIYCHKLCSKILFFPDDFIRLQCGIVDLFGMERRQEESEEKLYFNNNKWWRRWKTFFFSIQRKLWRKIVNINI